MALVSVSERLLKFVKKSPPATRYFDIARYSEYGSRGETPFTPALPIFYALDDHHIVGLFAQGLQHVEERERGR